MILGEESNYTNTQPHSAASADNGTPSLLTDNNSYSCDANGNQTTRVVNGETFTLSYDAENRLVNGVGGGEVHHAK